MDKDTYLTHPLRRNTQKKKQYPPRFRIKTPSRVPCIRQLHHRTVLDRQTGLPIHIFAPILCGIIQHCMRWMTSDISTGYVQCILKHDASGMRGFFALIPHQGLDFACSSRRNQYRWTVPVFHDRQGIFKMCCWECRGMSCDQFSPQHPQHHSLYIHYVCAPPPPLSLFLSLISIGCLAGL